MNRGKPEKYIALAGELRRMFDSRQLKRGDVLPSERKLAEEFSCNHLTIRKALRLLEQENYLYKVPSKGNYIGSRPALRERLGIVGFLIPEEELYYYKLFADLEKKLFEMGLHPMLQITGGSESKERQILEFLESVNATAVISVPNPACAETYRKLRIPAVFFDIPLKGMEIPYVVSDDYAGASAAVHYLCSIGHRRIAHIGSLYDRTAELRCSAYRDVLKQHSIPVSDRYISLGNPTREAGFYAARDLFALPEVPSAIFCGNDTIAAGVVRFLTEQRIPIPDGCSLIGFGNTEIAEDLNLTSVSQFSEKVARTLLSNLEVLLNGETPRSASTVETALVLRKSTAFIHQI